MELEERFWSKASWTLDGWGTRGISQLQDLGNSGAEAKAAL